MLSVIMLNVAFKFFFAACHGQHNNTLLLSRLIVMLNVLILSVTLPNVIMLSIVMQSVVMLL
jgi:hypothetical protein